MATLTAIVAFIASAKDRKGSSVQAIRKALDGVKPRKSPKQLFYLSRLSANRAF
jgi:hypothetical protein